MIEWLGLVHGMYIGDHNAAKSEYTTHPMAHRPMIKGFL